MRPPGDGFCPSRGWLVSGQDSGPCRRRQDPQRKPPSGQRATPLRYQARVPGSQGWCPGNCKASLQPRGSRVSPRTTLPSRSPTPAEAECPGKTFGPGAVAQGRPRFRARWNGPWLGRRTPTDAFSRGDSCLCPAWAAKSLVSAQTAPPYPKATKLDPAASNL